MNNIAEKIKQRRSQILVHSYIYYELDTNLVSDDTWSRWAMELVQLQNEYPEISESVAWSDVFKDFDGSSGAFLPIHEEWIVKKANRLLAYKRKLKSEDIKKQQAKTIVKRNRLF